MSTRVPLLARNPWHEQLDAGGLLLLMRCVMWDGNKGRWDARAKDREQYGHGLTPEAAMREALLKPEVKPAPTIRKRTQLL